MSSRHACRKRRGRTHGGAGYPNQSIRLVVPSAPGGGTDIIARLIRREVATRTKVVKAANIRVE